jgi:multidrug efflux pump subunit AcrB
MIFLPLLIGTIAAFATSLTIALTVVPSMTTTVLKLRSGVMEFMRDPKQVRSVGSQFLAKVRDHGLTLPLVG